jgi:hypothetical protein
MECVHCVRLTSIFRRYASIDGGINNNAQLAPCFPLKAAIAEFSLKQKGMTVNTSANGNSVRLGDSDYQWQATNGVIRKMQNLFGSRGFDFRDGFAFTSQE